MAKARYVVGDLLILSRLAIGKVTRARRKNVGTLNILYVPIVMKILDTLTIIRGGNVLHRKGDNKLTAYYRPPKIKAWEWGTTTLCNYHWEVRAIETHLGRVPQ